MGFPQIEGDDIVLPKWPQQYAVVSQHMLTTVGWLNANFYMYAGCIMIR